MDTILPTYEPRDTNRTVLYKVVSEHPETFLASADADPGAKGLPAYVERELRLLAVWHSRARLSPAGM